MSLKIAVIMGSMSDMEKMRPAIDTLNEFHVETEVKIVSAHRTPEEMVEFAKSAEARGIKVIIAGAGGAAHLPGMVASLTTLPVIGVPISLSKLDGLDSVLSILQMPKGVPVATVAIDNSMNAALLALRILSTQSDDIRDALIKFSNTQRKMVEDWNKGL